MRKAANEYHARPVLIPARPVPGPQPLDQQTCLCLRCASLRRPHELTPTGKCRDVEACQRAWERQ